MSALNAKYGMHSLTLAPMSEPGSGASNGALNEAGMRFLDLDNPMLWLVGIGAATLGLVAASTSLRVGPARASVSVGKK